MIKSFTDIEQSKKLTEILPTKSADMWYHPYPDDEYWYDIPNIGKADLKYNQLPCWSLAALLGVLPQSITKYIESERCQKTFHLNLFRSYYYCCSYSFSPSISDDDGDNTLYCVGRDNWVDACYEMIIKLNELNLL